MYIQYEYRFEDQETRGIVRIALELKGWHFSAIQRVGDTFLEQLDHQLILADKVIFLEEKIVLGFASGSNCFPRNRLLDAVEFVMKTTQP